MEHDLTTVRIIGLPVALHRAASEAHEALAREFAIIEASDDPSAVPARLLRLQADLKERYDHLSHAPLAVLQKAEEGGSATVDLEYLVPRSVADASRALRDLLAEADSYCSRGTELLTIASAPELVAYRNWFLDEFIGQIEDGRAPRSWADVETATAAPGATATRPAPASTRDEVTVSLRGAIDLESAPRIRSTVTRLRRQGAASIVLDLTAVDFVDSVGLGLLVSIHRRLHEEQRSLALSNVGSTVRQTLHIAGLEDLFAIRG